MINIPEEYKRIFHLRLIGKNKEDIAKELGITMEGLIAKTLREDFRTTERVLIASLLGGTEYDPGNKARQIAEEMDALGKLKDLATNTMVDDNVKIRALTTIIERGWGKPVEKVEDTKGELRKEMELHRERLDSALPQEEHEVHN